jgi:uncharacterized protein (TIGR02246 family)
MDDIEAIKQLKARYFRFMDTKDWEGYRTVFAEEAWMRNTPDPNEVFEGRDEIVKQVSRVLAKATTVHHGHTPEITLTGADSATGIWAMEDFVDMPQLVLHGWGHYHEEYLKRDGEWQILSSRLTRLRLDITPKQESGS